VKPTVKRKITAIIAPPPTPNGDLHVGHISGPYFGMDILRRYLLLRNTDVVAGIGVDLNQSYVVTTGERLGIDPVRLANQSHASIKNTLTAASISLDAVGMPNREYSEYVSQWFGQLHDAGTFEYREVSVPYDVKRKRFMFESYASGWCANCLASTCGGICEVCGHPNNPRDLFGLRPTSGNHDDPIEFRPCGTWVLELERWRLPLEEHLRPLMERMRPSLRRLVKEILEQPLPVFPVTFPSEWGLQAPMPGSKGLVLNVWAEMVPGHYYWLKESQKAVAGVDLLVSDEAVHYVQFLGFDNSFFYVFAHLALAFAAKKCGADSLLPQAFITNDFYLLDNYKFSTSQGHLIWGRDFLKNHSVDDARFYLAWSNPENDQSNFSQADFAEIVEKKFKIPLSKFLSLMQSLPSGILPDPDDVVAQAVTKRFEQAYAEESFSIRLAVRALVSGMELAIELASRGATPQSLIALARRLAAGAAPIVPETAQSIWCHAGGIGPILWPLPRSGVLGRNYRVQRIDLKEPALEATS
jgi:methionyl-tRNA synthetase